MLSRKLDRGLPVHDRVRLRLHLLMCAMCSAYEAQLRFLRLAYRKAAEKSKTREVRLSDAARQRIREAMRRATD
jgi:hypothetical protein